MGGQLREVYFLLSYNESTELNTLNYNTVRGKIYNDKSHKLLLSTITLSFTTSSLWHCTNVKIKKHER